jgi:hypothetical protein
MGCRKNKFVAQQIQKVISKVRKEIRKLSCSRLFSLLYYCLQEDNFGIGSKDNLIEKVFDAVESANWNNQFRHRLIKTLVAQAKYVKLLERRIGK